MHTPFKSLLGALGVEFSLRENQADDNLCRFMTSDRLLLHLVAEVYFSDGIRYSELHQTGREAILTWCVYKVAKFIGTSIFKPTKV